MPKHQDSIAADYELVVTGTRSCKSTTSTGTKVLQNTDRRRTWCSGLIPLLLLVLLRRTSQSAHTSSAVPGPPQSPLLCTIVLLSK